MARASKTAGVFVGGIALGGPLAFLAGPAIGGAIGSYLGLSGAAATSAGLALAGGGSLAAGGLGMAGGLAIIVAGGSVLGGAVGCCIAGHYLSDIKGFDLYRVRKGKSPAVITINGFLSQASEAHEGWLSAVDKHYANHAWYHVEWEAKNLANLGSICARGTSTQMLKQKLFSAAKSASVQAAKKFSAAATVTQALQLSTNPWHVAMLKAEKTGAVLADILQRCDRQRFVLMGHSLGARVIFSCLQALATSQKKRVADVHLFGGAVNNAQDDWNRASCALKPNATIRNYHSGSDLVLKYLYPIGTLFQSTPIGRYGISNVTSVKNYDLSSMGIGHMDYKRKLQDVLTAAFEQGAG